jgi:hypothetical protein
MDAFSAERTLFGSLEPLLDAGEAEVVAAVQLAFISHGHHADGAV